MGAGLGNPGAGQGFSNPAGANLDMGSYAVSFGSDPADAGDIRLSNNEAIAWENATPGTDLTLKVDATNTLVSSAPVSATGAVTASTNLVAGASGSVGFTGRSILKSSADGTAALTNAAATASSTLTAASPTTPRTSDLSVTAAMANTVFTNTGASGTVNFTLPTAAANLGPFIFVQDSDTFNLQVTASGSDVIRLGAATTAAGGNVVSSHVGDVLILVGIAALKYTAIQIMSPIGFVVT